MVFIMKLYIIGPDKRDETEIELVQTAKECFDSILYIPITKIRVETIENQSVPYFKDINLLETDVILPRVKKKDVDIYDVLLQIFKTNKIFIPFTNNAVNYGYNEFLIPFMLSKARILAPKTYFSLSRVALEKKLSTLIYPILVKLPYSKKGTIILDSESSVKGVLDTLEILDQPITLQETYENAIPLSILVIGTRTYAVKGKGEPYKLSKTEKQTIINASRILETKICQINALKTDNNLLLIIGMDIKPKIIAFEKAYNKKLIDITLKYLRSEAENKTNGNLLSKLTRWFDDRRWEVE